MVGLGETYEEIEKSLTDLHNSGCELLTVGQYLAPSENHHPVMRYYTPDEFEQIKSSALKIGFKGVVSGPLIRSSYKAYDMLKKTDE